MQKCFKKQIGRNLEVYVDNIVIKSQVVVQLIGDLEETLSNLRTDHIKLNPKKCTLGVPFDKLLGYIVSAHRI